MSKARTIHNYEKTVNGCWEWLGARNAKGYGRLGSQMAHRRVYVALKGVIPPGQLLLHSCDNPGCVNPEHLRLGSHQDNMDDMKTRRRSTRGYKTWRKGRLADTEVHNIRALAREYGQVPGVLTTLAAMYEIQPSMVSRIVRRQRYADVI